MSVPASAFPGIPDVEIELERLVPTGTEVVPLLWVTSDSREETDRLLADAPPIDEATDLTTDGTRFLYEMTGATRWTV